MRSTSPTDRNGDRCTIGVRFIPDGVDTAHDAGHLIARARPQILHFIAVRLPQLDDLIDRLAGFDINRRRTDGSG